MEREIEHILLVDDDQDDRYFFAKALEEANPDVQLSAASDGAEALEKLAFIRPDLILADLVMPGLSGITFIQKLKKDIRLSTIPVIVYTSDLSIFTEEDLLSLGVQEVVIKANDYCGTVQLISGMIRPLGLRKSA